MENVRHTPHTLYLHQELGKALKLTKKVGKNNLSWCLFLQSADGFVPVGTRQINVVLNANYVRGRVNDAYADNLSLVITKVPEPSISSLLLFGTSCLIAWKLRKHRQILQ